MPGASDIHRLLCIKTGPRREAKAYSRHQEGISYPVKVIIQSKDSNDECDAESQKE